MEGQLIRLNALLLTSKVNELVSQVGRLNFGDGPGNNVATEDVKDDIYIGPCLVGSAASELLRDEHFSNGLPPNRT